MCDNTCVWAGLSSTPVLATLAGAAGHFNCNTNMLRHARQQTLIVVLMQKYQIAQQLCKHPRQRVAHSVAIELAYDMYVHYLAFKS